MAPAEDGAVQVAGLDVSEDNTASGAALASQPPRDATGPAPLDPPDERKGRHEAEREGDGKAHAVPPSVLPTLKFCVLK